MEDLVNLVCANPAPVILLDTCSILDIPRSFHRELASSDLVKMTAQAIAATTASPPKLHLSMTGQTDREYTKNLPETTREVAARMSHFTQIGNTLLPASDAFRLASALTETEIRLIDLTVRLHTHCLTIAADPVCEARGLQRRAAHIAPGTRGTTNDADCVIVEHVLELAKRLRAAGFQEPCIFVSSNYKDFGRAPVARAPLEVEFAALSIDYMADIASAMVQAGL